MTIAEKITRIAEDMPKIYEAGKKKEYDAFWDGFQDCGNRTDYHYGFSGKGWSEKTFKPKYDIVVTGGDGMFMWFNFLSTNPVFDLKGYLDKRGLKLDFSQCTASCYRTFMYSKISKVGVIDLSKSATSLSSFFYYSTVDDIEKLIIPDNYTGDFTSMFYNCTRLVNIRFGGLIRKNIDFQYSPLNKESIIDICEHLSSDAIGQTITFKKTAKEAAFTDAEWQELIATKPNWTISLI